jgi:hypothetical protein
MYIYFKIQTFDSSSYTSYIIAKECFSPLKTYHILWSDQLSDHLSLETRSLDGQRFTEEPDTSELSESRSLQCGCRVSWMCPFPSFLFEMKFSSAVFIKSSLSYHLYLLIITYKLKSVAKTSRKLTWTSTVRAQYAQSQRGLRMWPSHMDGHSSIKQILNWVTYVPSFVFLAANSPLSFQVIYFKEGKCS